MKINLRRLKYSKWKDDDYITEKFKGKKIRVRK